MGLFYIYIYIWDWNDCFNWRSDYQDVVCHGLSENLHFQHIGQYLFSFPAQNIVRQRHGIGIGKVHLSRSGCTRAT